MRGGFRSALMWVAAAVAATLITLPIFARAQAYPTKPVRLMVAFAPGGLADRTARVIAQKASERLGQPFVLDNRSGAGGNIAAKTVADATPDGYTLLVHTAALSVAVSLYKDLGIDLLRDLAPIAMTGSVPGIFVVLSSHPANTLQDLIKRARDSGKPLGYATAGVGTSSHLAAEYLFATLAGIKANHIPFKGGAPALTAVLGGQVEVLSASMGGSVPFIKEGRLKGLAVSSLTRVDLIPNVPTVTEAGFPGFEERSWVGFFAPAKTPPAILGKLNGEINQILAMPDVRSVLESQALQVEPQSRAEFTAKLKREVAMWQKIVQVTGAKPE
jgi:tripartite-type tricarboxylate transporter receptor subunit TctC